MKTAFLLFFLIVMLFSLKANAQQTFNSLNVKELAVSGSVNVNSTTKSSKPCPSMTEAQRDLVATPVTGSCIYNSDTLTLNVYNGSAWKSAGGGVNQWVTGASYQVDDVIIESNKFYVCLIAHTSGTFAADLAALNWAEVSSGLSGVISLASGGTEKALTASDGAIAYSDTDSLELLAPGTSGQILQTNGAAAPTFVNKSISAKAENGSSVTLEEIQAPNNQFTTTATNKHLLNDCGSSNNLLANCGFEHSTPATSWTLANGSSLVETSNVKQGKQALKLTLSAQALDFYQTSTLNATAFADGVNGSISISVKTTVDNVYLCRTDSAGAVVASTDGVKITNCVKISNSGKWGDYVLPVILGATSNGLRLVSLTPSTAVAVAVTGDVYVDAGILEAGLKTQVVNNIGPWTSFTPTFTGFGTATSIEFFYRQSGQNVEIRGKFVSGTTTGVEARISLPDSYVSSGTTIIPTIQSVGWGEDSANLGGHYSILIEPSVAYVTIGISSSGTSGLTKALGNTLLSSGRSFSVFASIPISSLQGSTSVYTSSCGANCVDHLTASISGADAVSRENVNWLSGDCTDATTGVQTCNFVSGVITTAPNCTCSVSEVGSSTADNVCNILSISASSVVLQTTTNGVKTNFPTSLSCQKQGADFVASRNIVGSFADIPTTKGSNGADIQSVVFGASTGNDCATACTTGTCAICSRVGTAITSVAYSTAGSYAINGIKGTGANRFTCYGSGFNPGTGQVHTGWTHTANGGASSVNFQTINGTTPTNSSHVSATCIGIP